MKEQLSKRPKAQYTRKAKLSGELRAGSLGDLQPATSPKHEDHFAKRPWSKHQHQWLLGTTNAVCSLCGFTWPKDQLPALAQTADAPTLSSAPHTTP